MADVVAFGKYTNLCSKLKDDERFNYSIKQFSWIRHSFSVKFHVRLGINKTRDWEIFGVRSIGRKTALDRDISGEGRERGKDFLNCIGGEGRRICYPALHGLRAFCISLPKLRSYRSYEILSIDTQIAAI